MNKDSNDLVKELTAAVTEKTKAAAAAKTESSQAKSDHTSAVGELESLAAEICISDLTSQGIQGFVSPSVPSP